MSAIYFFIQQKKTVYQAYVCKFVCFVNADKFAFLYNDASILDLRYHHYFRRVPSIVQPSLVNSAFIFTVSGMLNQLEDAPR